MQEEFHGIYNDGNGPFKQLYGWGTISANVWLPSVSELVGYIPDTYNAASGCYSSAMQGLNTSWACVDKQGGAQWTYFEQFNTSGGGEVIWKISNQQQAWLRSCTVDTSQHAWRITNAQRFDYTGATASGAVHPAG